MKALIFIMMLIQVPAIYAVEPYTRSEWSSSKDQKIAKRNLRNRLLLATLQSAAMIADYELSHRHFENGGTETMPWFGSRRPGRARMYGIGIPLNFAAAMAGRKFQVAAFLLHGGGIGMTLRF